MDEKNVYIETDDKRLQTQVRIISVFGTKLMQLGLTDVFLDELWGIGDPAGVGYTNGNRYLSIEEELAAVLTVLWKGIK